MSDLKTNEKLHGNKKIPFVYCSTCRKYQPAIIESFDNKILKGQAGLISCGVCKYVQNWDRIPKMKWIRHSELKKKGWEVRAEKLSTGQPLTAIDN